MFIRPKEVILPKRSAGNCAICNDNDHLRNLYGGCNKFEKIENYVQMLMSCFHIKLIDPSDSGGLCETCVSRLRGAVSFRAQVEASGDILSQLTDDIGINDSDIWIIKSEPGSSRQTIPEKVDITLTDHNYTQFVEFLDLNPPIIGGESNKAKLNKKLNNTNKIKRRKNTKRQIENQIWSDEDGDPWSDEGSNLWTDDDDFWSEEDNKLCGDQDAISKTGYNERQTDYLITNPNEYPWSEEDNTESKKTDSKRIEWIDQPEFPQQFTFKMPTLQPNSNECPVCNEEFSNMRKMRIHFCNHFPQFLCDLCGKIFSKKESFKSHLETHEPERFPCPQCNKTYAKRIGVTHHVKIKHKNEKLYKCPQCLERFSDSRNRREHLLAKHGVWFNAFPCPNCQVKCYTANGLDVHIRKIHRKEKQVACPQCDSSFFNLGQLKNHLQCHSDARDFVCDLCGKAFKTRKHLRTHLDIHYNIRKHKCPACPQAFVQTSSLRAHMKSHNKTIPHNKTVKIDDSAAFSSHIMTFYQE